jgi:hypothetical protein
MSRWFTMVVFDAGDAFAVPAIVSPTQTLKKLPLAAPLQPVD